MIGLMNAKFRAFIPIISTKTVNFILRRIWSDVLVQAVSQTDYCIYSLLTLIISTVVVFTVYCEGKDSKMTQDFT